MNNLSKLLVGSVAAVTLLSSALVANAQVGDPELDMAVSWMSTNGMTKATNASNFNPAGTLTRDQGSKFFSEYAVSNLCLTPDASRSCSFSDLGQADPTLSSFVTKSCQLGIFNGSNGVFMPQAPLTKAQFITALIRAVDDMKNENVTPRWKNYHAKALQLNITKETDAWALDRPVTRYEAALMLYRSRVDACPSAGTTTTTTTTTTDNGGDLASILGELFGEEEETTSTTTTTTNSSANTGGEEVVVTTTTTAQPTCPAVVCGANDCGTVSNTCGNSANCGACPTTTVVTTTPTTTVTPTTVTPTTTTTTNTSGRGTATCNANVSLNPASPAGNGQEVPGLATAVVGMYDITATGGDLLVDNLNLERIGLGNGDAINFVAVYTLDGSRVSNAKTFNSDREARVSLNPKVTVLNGQTQTFVVVAEIGSSSVASNQEFAIRLNNFNSTCAVNVEAGEFEVAAVDAAKITIEDDGSIQNVELGNMQEEVAAFTIDNEDDVDVFITSITLRDDENNADDNLANFTLVSDGDVLATTPRANGRYVTFQLATPFLITDGDREDFEVRADVIAGAGEAISFYVDRSLDVAGFDDSFGYGLNVDVDGYGQTSQKFDITAGELTFVNHALPTDQTRADKDGVVLMEFHIDVQAGQDLTLEDIEFDIFSDTPSCLVGADIDDILEDIELKDLTNGGTYTLTTSTGVGGGDNCSIKVSDSNMGLNLSQTGQDHVFQLIADVTNDLQFITPNIGKEFYVELRPSSTQYVDIMENIDDETVTDIVPSFMASEAIELSASGVQVEHLDVTDVTVVNGGRNLLLVDFEIDTDDISPITFDELTVVSGGTCQDGSANGFDDTHISVVSLWRGLYPNGTLLESEDLNGATSITFDDFNEVLVPASSTQPMYITVDLVDDTSNNGSCISAEISSIDAEDDENDVVPFVIFPTSYVPNELNILGAGILTVKDSTNNVHVEDNKNILGGQQSDFVAAFELVAQDEDILLEDIIISETSNNADFTQAIKTLTVFDQDRTTILYGPKTVNSPSVYLNDALITVPQSGGKIIYVKLEADQIGQNRNGTQSGPFSLSLTVPAGEATGRSSGDDMTVAGGSTLAAVGSEPFSVVPVSISALSFEDESLKGGKIKTVDLTTNSNVAILRVTADSWTNTDSAGGRLDLQLETLTFDVTLGAGTTVGSFQIRKSDGNETAIVGDTATMPGKVIFDVSGSTSDFVLEKSEIADFVVEARNVTATSPTSSVQVEIDSLSSGAVVFSADDSTIDGYALITDPALGSEELDNAAVVVNN